MQRVARLWLAFGSIVALAGCSASGVHYSGVVADPVARANDVREAPALPGGTELGSISARCEFPRDSIEDGVSYGDLLCSEDLLRSALLQTTAHVGGTHLVDARCRADSQGHECHARVFVDGAPHGKLPMRPDAFDPFRIEVRLLAAPDQAVQLAWRRGADMAPRVPVSDRVIGELRAACDGSCDDARLREAISAGASYAGARHFGYPQCRDADGVPASGAASTCRSWASAYEVYVGPRK